MQKIFIAILLTACLGSCVNSSNKQPGQTGAPDGALPENTQRAGSVRTGMLILGSDDINTLRERVKLGYELYSSGRSFDYIIVSGGCGAHGSSICEASEMAALLTDMGVPSVKVHKEENSKSTVQNYCFSRELRGDDGNKLIAGGDSLYVVSNHWHAIPVAARFSTYDSVDAVYYIRGAILPSKTDMTDYTNIFDNGLNSEAFCN